ncbi:MAG: phosphatase PAP2 family protein [Rhodobacteraceae bacterium]|nr:phosphatase PAP2 family protein [Paracoccaceae bacterium]
MPTITYLRLLVWLLGVTLAVSALFTAFPQLDIAASALFYQDGFWLYELPALTALRRWLLWFMFAFAFGVLGWFLLALVRRWPLRAAGYSVLVILLGPLLLVNSILKDNWGRARPINIGEFGGDKLFSPAYRFTDQCGVNCSFTSGEGGAIATVAILIAFLAWPKLARNGRRWLVVALGLLVTVTAGLRVAMGQHFLSDTLLSILFVALVAAGLYRLFYPAKAP